MMDCMMSWLCSLILRTPAKIVIGDSLKEKNLPLASLISDNGWVLTNKFQSKVIKTCPPFVPITKFQKVLAMVILHISK